MKFPRTAALMLCVFLPACAKNPEGTADTASKPRLVGRIASIPADRNFTLIQSYGKWEVETGSILTTQGPEGRTANLLATGEKLGQYAAADIQSGTLEIGDGVYTLTKAPAPPEKPEESESPPNEEKSEPAEEAPLNAQAPTAASAP